MPYWMEPMLLLAPLAAWITLGVGWFWALVLTPDPWRADRGIRAAVTLALGLLFTTAWMFVLGTLGVMTLAGTLVGSVVIAGAGGVVAWRAKRPVRSARLAERLSVMEWVLIAAVVLLLVVNVLVTAYWPMLAYDVQWVYGYNAKVFVMRESIPGAMGYYPQLIPFSYTLLQQAWGSIDDHAARAIIPWITLGGGLMAYALGRIAFDRRRVGLLAAAGWMLYPHVAAWAAAGDLEIALALYTTGAATFFIAAWRDETPRSAVLSGLLLAGALWTKPTGGALALGMGAAVGVYGVSVRGWQRDGWTRWWPKLRLLLVTGLASAPLGGAWYVRNLILGHEPVTFPASYWHDFAQRSGQEFGWPLLLAVLVAGGVLATRVVHKTTTRAWLPWRNPAGGWQAGWFALALALLLVGTLPTALDVERLDNGQALWRWMRGDLSAAGRMGPLAWAAVVAGFALLAVLSRDAWGRLEARTRQAILLVVALALPYGVVWFRNFSYHYRLSFAIVPLAIGLVAALADGWLWDWLSTTRVRRAVGTLGLVALAGIASVAALEFSIDAWRSGGLPDDRAKYAIGNPSLMRVVTMLESFAAERDFTESDPPVVIIPGEDRLPFYFPDWDIRNSRVYAELPTTFEDVAVADVYVHTSVWRLLAGFARLLPSSLDAEASVGAAYHNLDVRGWDGAPWPTMLEPIPLNPDGSLAADDGNFRYEAFTPNPDARHAPMNPAGLRADRVLVGDFAQFVGHDVVTLDWVRGEHVPLSLYWLPTENAPPAADYVVVVRLLAEDGTLIREWSGAPLQGYYHTRFWRAGESLLDYWLLRVPEDAPPGPAQVVIGLIDPLTGDPVLVTVDGDPVLDGQLTINTRITVR